jgi:hypothetical protein
MNEENLLLALSAMFARQQLMIDTLLELMERGQPINRNVHAVRFLQRWNMEAKNMTAVMWRRLAKDDLQWTIEDLEKLKGSEPPEQGKGDEG